MMTIGENHILPLLMKACPSFAPMWKKFLREEYSRQSMELDDPGVFKAVGILASHIVNLALQKTTNELPTVFATIERLLEEGDPGVEEIVVSGLVEGIQKDAADKYINLDVFEPYLKPRTAFWWQQSRDYWDGWTPYIDE